MSFRCGVFTSPTSTGTADFSTGLPGQCTALYLVTSASTAVATVEDSARVSFGATDGTTQWAVSAGVLNDAVTPVVDANDVMDTSHSNTSIVRIINESGTVLAAAEFVSFNGDGTVTLDWTTAPGTAIKVSFWAWDQVTALCGVNLMDTSETQTVDFSAAINTIKCVIGANQRDVNDGTVSMGWNDAPHPDKSGPERVNGSGYAVRVDVSNNFQVTPTTGIPYQFTQAATAGTGGGDFENFTSTTFDIVLSNTGGPTFTDEPVAWLAIGDGGPWFPQGAPLRAPLDPLEPLPIDTQIPLGLIHMFNANLGTSPNEHRTFGWGAWDNTDNQVFVLNYLERDTAGVRNAVTGRATYDDRIDLQLTNKSTVSGYLVLTDDGAGGPHHATTGTQPQTIENQNAGLYFVYLPFTVTERFYAVLV